jgi:hypothetical protein
MSSDKNGNVVSVDPDGGPNIFVNKIITIDTVDYVVTKINKYTKDSKGILNILVDVIIRT